MKKPSEYHSLSRRIVIQFCAFTLVLSLIYSVMSFVLMYTLEDSFIEREIAYEASRVSAEYKETGHWPEPRKETMSLHFSRATFPEDIRERAISEPKRVEFFSEDGRHYHIYSVPEFENVYLLAEVGEELVVRQVRFGVITFLTISSLIITSIACFMAWLIGRRTTQPLKKLAALVDGVAPEHIPDAFSNQFPKNEIGILATTLEHAFMRIKQAIAREKHFTRDVSHELRTPVAVIKNALELRQRQQETPKTNKEIFDRVSEAAEQIDLTVTALLLLAREESAHGERQRTSLMSIVERAVLNNRVLLEGKEVEIHISDNCNTRVFAQPGMLKVLLDNLLSNAFQYTAAGEITVDYFDKQLVVKDTGPGIEQGISERITELGIKGNQSTGLGFGLSIVKRLCEHQGWTLSIDSDHGTTISVLLDPRR